MMSERQDFVVYNSMTKRKELFKPLVPGKVGIYVCGITSYALSHIGHARAAVAFDLLYRYLEYLGYEVTYVRNFTDVDDKIIRQANENKKKQQEEQGNVDEYETDPLKLSERFCKEYLVDMGDLQCRLPTHQPRVTQHMEQIKDMITQIINNGYAYAVDGDVFYEVEKFPNYGMLSGQKLENVRAGERVDVDTRKRNPADFALWKAAKPDEPSWESPWGLGRPGWHIECSAMSANYLSYKFDIHGGGIDLIFPHHENEIAQSCAACKESTVTYWLHNGHVTNKDVKMSKSLGNYSTIRQITKDFHPLALRHFLISAHYSSPLNYSVSQLDSSSEAIFYIYQTLQDCEDALLPFEVDGLSVSTENKGKVVGVTADAKKCISKLKDEFETKMADDLSTSHILTGAFQDALKFINSSVSALKKKMQKQQQLSLVQSLRDIQKEIKVVLEVLGLLSPLSYAKVLQQLKEKALIRAGLVEDNILQLIEDRKTARNNKDFARSDQIRAELSVKGIALMDVGKETIWRPCVQVRQEEPPSTAVVKDQVVPQTAGGEEQVPAPSPSS